MHKSKNLATVQIPIADKGWIHWEHIHITEYYIAIKMIESWHQGTQGVNLSNKILTEESTAEIMYNMVMEYI